MPCDICGARKNTPISDIVEPINKVYKPTGEAFIRTRRGRSQGICMAQDLGVGTVAQELLNPPLLTTLSQPVVRLCPEGLVLLRDLGAGRFDTSEYGVPERECCAQVVLEVYRLGEVTG